MTTVVIKSEVAIIDPSRLLEVVRRSMVKAFDQHSIDTLTIEQAVEEALVANPVEVTDGGRALAPVDLGLEIKEGGVVLSSDHTQATLTLIAEVYDEEALLQGLLRADNGLLDREIESMSVPDQAMEALIGFCLEVPGDRKVYGPLDLGLEIKDSYAHELGLTPSMRA